MYDPDDIPPLRPIDCPDKPDYHPLIRQFRQLELTDEAEMRKIMAIYLGMVSYTDHLLGRLLDALDETGLAGDTTVFAFSDHGDWAGDYGLIEKWPSGLDDCLTRIPMLVRTPNGAQGHVVNEPIECFDIMPTTLELAEIEAQHTHHARSMVPQLQGETGDPSRAVFAEGGYDLHEPLCFEGKKAPYDIPGNSTGVYYPKGLQQQEEPQSVCRATMIRTSTHKLVRRPNGQHELYDMINDPQELNNRWHDESLASIKHDLELQMLDWYIHTADVTPRDIHRRFFDPEEYERFARK